MSYIFNFKGDVFFSEALVLIVFILAFQLIVSKFYLDVFKMGPLENLWRRFTYNRLVPLRKKKLPIN
ncbi:MAG TPA: DUF418 domain-containing protein [Candidatus Sphingobacterium stercoripullorum]|uniref:DUF418 domain-containing protein n=1 Tax=Candidatus Sphingobacterium stercoripullorum TaxID=2838759 RepID=A0A9D1WAL3_9SPHI|nr:DUF418 domain-containing protein [Candidatus Sphingobacterium stercoripullorum]